MNFPLYRKYSDGNTIFRIESINSFTEYKKTGKYLLEHKIVCELYPEKLFLNDLIHLNHENVIEITEENFNTIKNDWELNLIKH
ncbi:MAG: hypothetical protein KDC13_00750 [Bacteroidetes bacterium]|nr:hypothetical protein [Bacteroidota bacterium]